MLISQSFLWVIDSLDPSLSAYPVLRFNIYPGPPFILYATLACWKFLLFLWHATKVWSDMIMVPRCYDEGIASKNLCNGYKDTCVYGHMDLKMVYISNISNEFSNFFFLGDSTLHIGPVMWWIWFENRGEQHQPQLNTCKSSSFVVLFFLVYFSPPFLACSETFKLVLIIAHFWCQEGHPQGYKDAMI